jgi:hypothetical protein
VGSSRSCSQPVVPASVRTWQIVCLVGVDSPCGASWSGVLRVHRVFLNVFVSFRLASCFLSGGVWLTDRLGVVDRPRGTSCSRTVRGQARAVRYSRCASGGSIAFFRLSARGSRTVRPVLVDSLPQPRGPSSWAFAVAKSSLVLLSLWDCLGFVPRVGRSVVTTRPWKTRVGKLGCEFGT